MSQYQPVVTAMMPSEPEDAWQNRMESEDEDPAGSVHTFPFGMLRKEPSAVGECGEGVRACTQQVTWDEDPELRGFKTDPLPGNDHPKRLHWGHVFSTAP